MVVNVNANGVIFSQDASTGCVINGQVSIIDSRYNAYRVQYSYSSCVAANAFLNGTTMRGIATLDNTAPPDEFIIAGVTGTAGSTRVAIVHVLIRI